MRVLRKAVVVGYYHLAHDYPILGHSFALGHRRLNWLVKSYLLDKKWGIDYKWWRVAGEPNLPGHRSH